MGQKAVIHSIKEITGTQNKGEVLIKIDVSVLEETANTPLREDLDVTIMWTDPLDKIEQKIHDTILTFAHDNNYLELVEQDILMHKFMKGVHSTSNDLRTTLQSVNKIQESRLELISMTNSINNNTFTTNDIIPAIKKLASIDKAIINMLSDIS